MTDDRPILFFDSGMGGLSVLAPTAALLPHAPLVYVADSAGFPYGTRSEGEIAARVPALLGRLAERYDPRLIVIACNTASTIALQHVRAALDVPIVGTVPAIKPAALLSETRVIGVLGTEATVRQPYVDDLAARFAGDCTVLRHGSASTSGKWVQASTTVSIFSPSACPRKPSTAREISRESTGFPRNFASAASTNSGAPWRSKRFPSANSCSNRWT